MTGQFFNPFEEQVVQQTIDDTLRAAAQQDIAQRASDIARGGQSAFGSRARLTAEERQRGLGRGLGEVLSKIRSGGFLTAQDRALQELQRQRDAARQAASLEQGFGQDLSAAQRLFGSDIRDLGATQQRLRGIDIANLTGLGATERGIEEQRLARQFAQRQATRDAPLRATQFVKSFAPQYVSGKTQIEKTFGMPRDPVGLGLSAALGAYRGFRQPPQSQNTNPYDVAIDEVQRRRDQANIGANLNMPASIAPPPTQFPTTQQFGTPMTDYSGFLSNPMQRFENTYQPGQINMPSSLPAVAPTLPSFGLPPAFNVDNPFANLPYNPLKPFKAS